MKDWLRHSAASTYQQAENEAQQAGLGVGIFDLRFGGSNARMDYRAWKDEFLRTDYSLLASNDTAVERIQTVSKALTDLAKACIEQSGNGLFGSITPSPDRSHFTFTVYYRSTIGERPRFDSEIEFTPASVRQSCTPGALSLFGKGREIPVGGVAVTCAWNPCQDLTITMNAGVGRAYTLPADPPEASVEYQIRLSDFRCLNEVRVYRDVGATLGVPDAILTPAQVSASIQLRPGQHKINIEGVACGEAVQSDGSIQLAENNSDRGNWRYQIAVTPATGLSEASCSRTGGYTAPRRQECLLNVPQAACR